MNRWLAKWGVKLASEKKERELAKKWSAGDIEVEAIPFSFSTSNGEELRAAPCVYTQDLVQRILSYLDELEESVLNTICTYIQYAFAYLAHTACSQVLLQRHPALPFQHPSGSGKQASFHGINTYVCNLTIGN